MTRTAVHTITALAAVLSLCACQPESVPPGEARAPQNAAGAVLARVDGEIVTRDDLDPELSRDRDLSAQLDVAIASRLVAREARRRGLDQALPLRERIARIRSEARREEERVLREALFDALRSGVAPSEAELVAHYDETRARYFERQYRVRRQRFDSEAAARAADASLGASGRLDPGASEEIGPTVAAGLPRELLPAALRLRRAGERVVIAGDRRAELVELVALLPSVPRPFEAVRDRVEQSLRSRRAQAELEALVARLRATAEIEIDEGAVADATAITSGDDSAH